MQRSHNLNKQPRGEYIVPRPDYLLSINSYDELKLQGIEIYSGIDAYACYITQIYISISNKTNTSLLIQYLIAIRAYSRHPQILCSDCRVETLIYTKVHYSISCITQLDVSFLDIYFYSTSIYNVQIESQWGQLEKSCLYR